MRLSLGHLDVDLDSLDTLATWLDAAATRHDEAGHTVRSAFVADWSGSAAVSGDLAQERWAHEQAVRARDLRILAAATRSASRGYAEAGRAATGLWAQVGL